MLDGRDLGPSRKMHELHKSVRGRLESAMVRLGGLQRAIHASGLPLHRTLRGASLFGSILALQGGGAVPLALVSATEVGD